MVMAFPSPPNTMKIQKLPCFFLLALACFVFVAGVSAQSPSLLKRTTFKTDTIDFGAGGTLAIVGAPNGSISIEGWQKPQVEISAEIVLQAPTESDLAKLAEITGYALDESMARASIISIGTHLAKRPGQKKVKLPKDLIGLPFRIDYKIKVPRYCDLEIDGGAGDLNITAVEGTMRINYLKADARLELLGGSVVATFGSGTVDFLVPARNWRARSADVQVATGELNVYLPVNISSELDATVLRSGKIENELADLKPRNRNIKFTDRSILAKAGSGGVPLRFTVGDGTLRILPSPKPQ
jgi:hypothetical protein